MEQRWAIAIHGGIDPDLRNTHLKVESGEHGCEEKEESSLYPQNNLDIVSKEKIINQDLERALEHGKSLLRQGSSSVNAAESVVKMLEDSKLFNAGINALLPIKAGEMEAAIMEGKSMLCGAVSGVKGVYNPVTLCRGIMERHPGVLYCQEGAEQVAHEMGVAYTDEEHNLRSQSSETLDSESHNPPMIPLPVLNGSVGCVCLDKAGNLAAATSTVTSPKDGDADGGGVSTSNSSACIGCTTYANTECAVSVSGTDIKSCIAHDVLVRMEQQNGKISSVVEELMSTGIPDERQKCVDTDSVGLVALTRKGEVVMKSKDSNMFCAAADSTGLYQFEKI